MTASGPPRDDATRRGYDAVARAYADELGDELAAKPLDRALLRCLADQVRPGATVVDLGCGPGHVTQHLASLGLVATGLDVSQGMVDVARSRHPDLVFERRSMLDLDPSVRFDAGVAFYSLIHFEPDVLSAALARIRSVLVESAPLLVSFHVGDETRHVDELMGSAVDLDFRFLLVADVLERLAAASFEVEHVVERRPYAGVEVQTTRAYVQARAVVRP